MSQDPHIAMIDPTMKEVLVKFAAYFEKLLVRQENSFQIAHCLNGDMRFKFNDTRKSLIAIIEEHLAARGERLIDGLDASVRISYYEGQFESKLASNLHLPEWREWSPVLTMYAYNTGVVLTGTFGIASILVFGVSSAVAFAALSALSALATSHTEKIPGLMDNELSSAMKYLGEFLDHVEVTLIQFIHVAESSLDAEIDRLKNKSTSSS
jgi:hypothetical protein